MRLSSNDPVCILDSCRVGHLGSRLLIAGLHPIESIEISDADPETTTIALLDQKLASNAAAIFTLSYELGAKLQNISTKPDTDEPDLFLALFAALVIHDYDSGRTFLVGDEDRFTEIRSSLTEQVTVGTDDRQSGPHEISSNFTQKNYEEAVEQIREYIRAGDTYQTNLTQRLLCSGIAESESAPIFRRLRRDHPAPFAAFIRRPTSTVVSASPERFFRIDRDNLIEASPIKGTRRRGKTADEDARLRAELESSEKDRAENTMIVDLVRNDLGRVCEFGSVHVEKLCEIEEHPTLFHLVSTVKGKLRRGVKFSEILRATFPCGSITGAPKIRTMKIIDELEPTPRGLSMGAIGVHLPESWDLGDLGIDTVFDLSVAIRTMVLRKNEAVFNVGGGVVIDSRAEDEYEESLLKAKALLAAVFHKIDPLPREHS